MPYLEKRHHLEHNGRKWIEVEQYFSVMYGNHDTRLPRWKMTSEQVEIINRRRAAKGLRRLILLNFSPGDLYLTFTYRKGVRVTPEEAVKILDRFMRRLKYQYNKRGQPFKWIKTTGLTSTGKAHHHVIMNRVEGVPYDKVIAKYFPYGRVCTEYLYEDGEYKQLADYFIKHKKETAERKKPDEKVGALGYSCSKNLKRSNPKPLVIREAKIKRQPRVPRGYDLEDIEEGSTKDGYLYRYYTLRKRE